MALGLIQIVFPKSSDDLRTAVILAFALFLGAPFFALGDDGVGWTLTKSLSSARAYATATLLPDGHVLLVGGHGCNQDLDSVELYDPSKNDFVSVSSLHFGRANHTATLLHNGLVLVTGGQFQGHALASAELYNASTKTWSDTGSLHTARAFHTATLLSNGQVLVVGGTDTATPPIYPQGAQPGTSLTSAELYDPATGKWTFTGSLHLSRFEHTATLLGNGDVLVTGGLTSAEAGDRPSLDNVEDVFQMEHPMKRFWETLTVTSSAELYNPSTENWSNVGRMDEPLFAHAAALLTDGQVLVAGGKPTTASDSARAELFDPGTKVWRSTGNLHIKRNSHSVTLMPDGQVLVIGGANDPDGVLTSTETFDPKNETWSLAPGLKSTHSLHTATLLPDGRVLVAGGCYALGAPTFIQSSAEIYGPMKTAPEAIAPNEIVRAPPSPAPANLTYVRPALPFIPPSSIVMMTSNLVVVTLCVVIITGCAVVLSAVWMVLIVVRRWGK